MANINKKVFFRKTGGFDVYKWSPSVNNYNKQNNSRQKTNYFCTATANSQGVDFISTYDYNIMIIDGVVKRLAYVACDYVV